MSFFPNSLLKRLYTRGSAHKDGDQLRLSFKNRLSDAEVTAISSFVIAGKEIDPKMISLDLGKGEIRTLDDISEEHPVSFPLKKAFDMIVNMPVASNDARHFKISINTVPFGVLSFHFEDIIAEEASVQKHIPRDDKDDYNAEIIAKRQEFVEKFTGSHLHHTKQYSFDPHIAKGNIENFGAVAQIPIGFAGPIQVNGQHAEGEFIVPMATTEGTLVASYSRGAKLLNLNGGVKATVVGDNMQRAPVFIFEDARASRKFVDWITAHLDEIREEAQKTSSVAKLKHVDYYLLNHFAYLRFNYTTGDAAGQNMVGKATFAACNWILNHFEEAEIKNFYLESNFATDKKASQINMMRTRGKRVVAEAIVRKEDLKEHMNVDAHKLHAHWKVANMGSMLSGANNNGCHSANAITALFIATGQDVANVAESSAALLYTDLTENGDLLMSITIPSLIVATYGGGTGLATQKECLEMMGCYGKGKVYKFAEIVASVVLAGELSLASAISSLDWVSSHERLGRNR